MMWTSHLDDTVAMAHPSGGDFVVMTVSDDVDTRFDMRPEKSFSTPAEAASEHFRYTETMQHSTAVSALYFNFQVFQLMFVYS